MYISIYILYIHTRVFHKTFYCPTYYSHPGFLDSDPLREADEDSVSDINLNSAVMTEEEREEIQQELTKVWPSARARAAEPKH